MAPRAMNVDEAIKCAVAQATSAPCDHFFGSPFAGTPVCSGCSERVARFLGARLIEALGLLEGPGKHEDWSDWRSRSVAFVQRVASEARVAKKNEQAKEVLR